LIAIAGGSLPLSVLIEKLSGGTENSPHLRFQHPVRAQNPTYRDYRIKDHVIKILDVSDVSLYVTAPSSYPFPASCSLEEKT